MLGVLRKLARRCCWAAVPPRFDPRAASTADISALLPLPRGLHGSAAPHARRIPSAARPPRALGPTWSREEVAIEAEASPGRWGGAAVSVEAAAVEAAEATASPSSRPHDAGSPPRRRRDAPEHAPLSTDDLIERIVEQRWREAPSAAAGPGARHQRRGGPPPSSSARGAGPAPPWPAAASFRADEDGDSDEDDVVEGGRRDRRRPPPAPPRPPPSPLLRALHPSRSPSPSSLPPPPPPPPYHGPPPSERPDLSAVIAASQRRVGLVSLPPHLEKALEKVARCATLLGPTLLPPSSGPLRLAMPLSRSSLWRCSDPPPPSCTLCPPTLCT